ncbi:hypothetical protein LAN33_24985, partial [Mycobacterium tuberculosis]|nr:hypothetical protein [Mycobacterium tuberculosis]
MGQRELGNAFVEPLQPCPGCDFLDSTTHSLPPAAARRVLDCDINFKKADRTSCLFAQAGPETMVGLR